MKQKTDIYHVEADINHKRNGKISSKLKKIGSKIAGTLTLAMATLSFHATRVLAAAPPAKGAAQSNDAKTLVSGIDNLAGLATTIVVAIGVVVAVFGGLQLGLGFAQDNPDAQSRGVKFLVGGIIGASVVAIIKYVTGK